MASAYLDKPSVRRPILSVRTPVEAAEARASYVQRVVFEQPGPRDWTIFEQYARDANIALLEIRDPYCCAHGHARGRLGSSEGRRVGKEGVSTCRCGC